MLAVVSPGRSHFRRPASPSHDGKSFLQLKRAGSIFRLLDLFAGGNIRRLTIFALGIKCRTSTASIILQLADVVVPTLEKLSQGRRVGPPQDHAMDALLTLSSRDSVVPALRRAFSGGQGIVISPGIRLRAA